MAINLSNFLISKKDSSKMADFQDLDHLDGLSISVTSANLYNNNRDDLVMFYFRDGAEYASVYTQSKVISENIKIKHEKSSLGSICGSPCNFSGWPQVGFLWCRGNF